VIVEDFRDSASSIESEDTVQITRVADGGARIDRGLISGGAEVVPKQTIIEIGGTKIDFDFGTRESGKVGLRQKRFQHAPACGAK